MEGACSPFGGGAAGGGGRSSFKPANYAGAHSCPLSHGEAVTASRLPARSAMDGRHWRPSPHRGSRDLPPPVGEVSSHSDDGRGVAGRVEWRQQNPGAPLRRVFPVPRGHAPHPRLTCRFGRFAPERHWRSLTPLPYGKCVKEDSLAVREGEDYSIHLISKGGADAPPLEPSFSRPGMRVPLRGEGGPGARWAPFCADRTGR